METPRKRKRKSQKKKTKKTRKPRLALFGGSKYYPLGGWNDFIDFVKPEEAHGRLLQLAQLHCGADAEKLKFVWYHVVNVRTGERVAEHVPTEG